MRNLITLKYHLTFSESCVYRELSLSLNLEQALKNNCGSCGIAVNKNIYFLKSKKTATFYYIYKIFSCYGHNQFF